MSALVRSELLKIRTTRSWWAYLIVIVLLTGIAVAGQVGSAGTSERSTVEFQLGLVDTVGLAVLLAIILGITIDHDRVPPRHDHAHLPRGAAP